MLYLLDITRELQKSSYVMHTILYDVVLKAIVFIEKYSNSSYVSKIIST